MKKIRNLFNFYKNIITLKLMIIPALLAIFLGVSNTAVKWQVGKLADINLDNSSDTIWYYLGVALLVSTVSSFLLHNCSTRYEGELYSSLIKKIVHKNITVNQYEADRLDDGFLTTIITKDCGVLSSFFMYVTQTGFVNLASFVASNVALALIHPLFSVVASAFGIVPVLISRVNNKKMLQTNRDYQASFDSSNKALLNAIQHIESIKAMQLELSNEFVYAKTLQEVSKAKRKNAFSTAFFSAPATMSSFLTLLALAILGGVLTAKGIVSLGSLFVIIMLSDNIVSPLMSINRIVTLYKQAVVSIERITRLCELSDENLELGTELSNDEILDIEIRNVSFSYDDEKTFVFRDLNYIFKPGKVNYIIGENGSGKSTLIKLLTGVYGVMIGNIYINGAAIDTYKISSIRSIFSVATQEPLLFAQSIYDNLCLGNHEISMETVIETCRKIGIHDEIMGLPDKYQTVLGDNGSPLSKGQRQRITIVRALLKEARIYVFDEPTTAIDTQNVNKFVDYIRLLAIDKIVIVITHNHNLIRNIDYVLRMK